MTHTINVYGAKGGVGTSTVTKADIVIIDWGTEIPYLGATAPNETNVMVTTTDYLSIKRGTRKVGPDHRVVVVEKEHSCLTPTDAINAFGRPSTILKASGNAGIARQVDAGLILSRIPRTAEVLHELLP